jgi:hypothetical protein
VVLRLLNMLCKPRAGSALVGLAVLVAMILPAAQSSALEDWGGGVYSAMVIVGLCERPDATATKGPVHGCPSDKRHTMEEVITLVEELREHQAHEPGATFIPQKGVYKRAGGAVIEEDSIRVIVLNLGKESRQAFKEHMFDVASALAKRLNQDMVILEFQQAGVTEHVWGVDQQDWRNARNRIDTLEKFLTRP